MSNIDKRALREAAEKATKGDWTVEFDDEVYSTDGVNHEQIAMVFSENEARDAAFISAANPATVLALLDELEADKEQIKTLESRNRRLEGIIDAAEKRIAEPSGQKRLIGWRASDYTDETSDPELAKNWAAAIGVLPIFEGDVNTKLSVAGIGEGDAQ
ncbi:ead/Ea22-like family protein [Citrobacter farmeri]|uniref:ead/Ea22-like family protein n=1 Tax=Citrobacter farmeri TaxID=67824 RepID=UPI001E3DD385|nr:ead/Ea22-like family protein [Citrobacter farmeri]MDB2181127.1 ead/Ea22-like family protein [Citrobacter farmeri]